MTSHKYYEYICYFDFEASTDTSPHQAYCVSFCLDNEMISFWGKSCAKRFVEFLPDKTLAIAHNLSYDFTFIIDELT